jgi:hypothetical protein
VLNLQSMNSPRAVSITLMKTPHTSAAQRTQE